MQKCCICGIKDQDYDKTGFQDETGYYCFNCKPKIINTQSSVANSGGSINSEQKPSSYVTYQENNMVASLLKGFAVFLGFCFLFSAIWISSALEFSGNEAFIAFITYFGIGFVISLFMYAAGEVVQLLHNIDTNTKKN